MMNYNKKGFQIELILTEAELKDEGYLDLFQKSKSDVHEKTNVPGEGFFIDKGGSSGILDAEAGQVGH